MSSRKRKRKRIETTPVTIAPKWIKEKLILELQKCGITVPDSFGVQTLLKLYNENKDRPGLNNSSVTSDTNNIRASPSQNNQVSESSQTALLPPNIRSDLDVNAASIVNTDSQRRFANSSSLDSQQILQVPDIRSVTDTNVSFANSNRQPISVDQNVPVLIPNQQQTVIQQPDIHPNLDSSGYTPRAATDNRFDLQSTLQKMRQPAVPSEQYRNVEIVSPNLRNQILSGKDINLALLLMPNNDNLTEYRRIDFNGIEYSMRPGDPRLARNLSLGEFIIAFARYRNIICEVMPHRREELDFYERDIVEMAQRFGGTRFYEYHKAFSAKAAALLLQRSIKVDWAVRDNGLYCTVFAGMRANVCTLCSSVNHTSEFCSLVVNPYWKRATQQMNGGTQRFPNPSNVQQQGKRYEQTFFQGIPLCINYNERNCTRPACRYLHLCSACNAPHPKSKCIKTSKTNIETKGADKKKE